MIKKSLGNTLPENHFLSKINWQVIGTLTFVELLPESHRKQDFLTLMRKLAKGHRVHWSRLLWVLKQEYGGDADFPHFHFLVAGLPQPAVCEASCRQIQEAWKQVSGGLSRIQLYDPALDGRDYVLKRTGEKSGDSQRCSGNLEDTSGLMLSKSIPVYLKRR